MPPYTRDSNGDLGESRDAAHSLEDEARVREIEAARDTAEGHRDAAQAVAVVRIRARAAWA